MPWGSKCAHRFAFGAADAGAISAKIPLAMTERATPPPWVRIFRRDSCVFCVMSGMIEGIFFLVNFMSVNFMSVVFMVGVFMAVVFMSVVFMAGVFMAGVFMAPLLRDWVCGRDFSARGLF